MLAFVRRLLYFVNMKTKYPSIRVRDSDLRLIRRIAKANDLKLNQVMRIALQKLDASLPESKRMYGEQQ